MPQPLLTEAQVIDRVQRGLFPALHDNHNLVVFNDGCKAKAGVMMRLAKRGMVTIPTNGDRRFHPPQGQVA